MSVKDFRDLLQNQLDKLDPNNPDHHAKIQRLNHYIHTYNNNYEENLRYFFDKYPYEDDIILLILRGHLLIERQVKKFVMLHFANQEPLKRTKFETNHYISLAEGFCTPHSPETLKFWACVRKLNKIRNDLSHQIEPKGLSDRIIDFIDYSWGFVELSGTNQSQNENLHDCIRSLHSKILYLASAQEHIYENVITVAAKDLQP